MDADSDDPRDDELSSLHAIFPELEPNDQNPYSFSIELPVHPAKPVTVTFPAASNADVPAAAQIPGVEPRVESHELFHLPSVVVRISLPQGYPSEKPPSVSISTSPPWLSKEATRKLEDDGPRLWEEMGRDMVAFTYIDHVQQAADDVFGMVDGNGALEIDPLHKIAVLDYDIEATRAAFAKETFDCGVCLDPKKGSVCHKMLDCGHIFCTQCLQEFYDNAITEGDLATVRCLAPNCAKERAETQGASGRTKKRKVKTAISPSELLQMGLSQDTVTRYVTLKYKNELESDKNTIYCPRSWCNGAARSKKHRKPDGLEDVESSDEETDEEGQGTDGKQKTKKTFDVGDLLAICEDCGFAFCSRCFQSWHGEFFRCTPKRDKEEMTAEEQASIDYINLHTTPCPTCGVPAQKTHGCNHMICFRCASHFCYLCSAWLDPRNPYAHFNEQPNGKFTSCYMRLWELEGGDGDDVDVGFAGGRQQQQQAPQPVEVIDIVPEIEEPDDTESEDEADNAVQEPRPPAGGVAREGPLVLRIGADPAPRGGRGGAAAGIGQGPIPPAAPIAPAPPARRGGHQPRGGRGRGNRGAMDGRGGRRQNQQRNPNQNQAQRVPVAGGGNGAAGVIGDGELNPQHEAWIRHFVQMALMDEEDSDDDS
ncbi:E3 ubiquitin-protein ligase itt1 [Colletotrichum siamense]|uniref:E3 ubiquitin-protein ligase itt1 n=1 Tax=Colletotrichum siamense TaxID=690259 RepID=UPI00187310BF|nr:E3 ubiquitin-protein ligase itt1 [Colletotrichum siamense]KAF5506590.1 E3 ubiquitin-protein ligase itt1 [Colletotrichum siamense]